MFCNATLAPPAVFASQWRPDHARNAEMGFVILPLADQLIDDGLLLSDAVHLWHKTRVLNHAPDVEKCRHAVEHGKEKIEQPGAVCAAVSNLAGSGSKYVAVFTNLP